MLKLTRINSTQTFTSAEIGDFNTEPPLVYEIHASRPEGWTVAAHKFLQTPDADTALNLVGLSLISVTEQGGERHPVGSRDKAEALRDSVESLGPGLGETYILHLAHSIINRQLAREEKLLGNSETLSPASDDGESDEPPKSPGKK